MRTPIMEISWANNVVAMYRRSLFNLHSFYWFIMPKRGYFLPSQNTSDMRYSLIVSVLPFMKRNMHGARCTNNSERWMLPLTHNKFLAIIVCCWCCHYCFGCVGCCWCWFCRCCYWYWYRFCWHSSMPGNCLRVCVPKLRNHKIIFALTTMKGNWFCYVYGSLYVVKAINEAEVAAEKCGRQICEVGRRRVVVSNSIKLAEANGWFHSMQSELSRESVRKSEWEWEWKGEIERSERRRE